MNINNIHDIFFQNSSQTEAGSRTTNVKTTFDTDIFTESKKNKSNTKENFNEINVKYFDASNKIFQYMRNVYSTISKMTGVSDFNSFPSGAKSIALKMNNYCNSLTAGKLANAKSSNDFDSAVKSILSEAETFQNQCINELNNMYGNEKKIKTENSENQSLS